jgi:hypothetical protein
MKATITSIQLKGPFKFFALSARALKIIRQLKAGPCRDFKKKGWGSSHYTMSLWDSEEELKAFARSGAHREAMQASASIAREIRTITIEAQVLPDWPEAKALLAKGKVFRYE